MRRAILLFVAASLVAGPIMLISSTATAFQITQRSVTISSAQAGQTANYVFSFVPAQTTQIQSITFQTCTTPLGACTAPSGVNIGGGTVSTGGFQGATSFIKDTTTNTASGNCANADVLCIVRSATDTTAQTLTTHTVTDTGAVNQNATNCSAAPNCTFFVRITTYSGIAFTTPVDAGVVASSTTQLFTVNAAIQEVLSFCIGSTTIDDVTTTPPTCSTISGTSLNLGTLDSGHVNISPVTAINHGDGNNALAELSTNAFNGTTVAYDAIQQSGTNHKGTLRVLGATCATPGVLNTDQCVNAAGGTRTTLTAATESFGMTIAGVNCQLTLGYTCSYTGNTYNLRKASNYDGTGVATTYLTEADQITGTTAGGYAWDESGAATTIASSSTVVDKEALIIKFAATPTIVTPTGSYQAQADYVATPTY
ncbi:MAG TPA: hypothetical protein VLG27_02175 [Candidatus Saccharimonadia bacterium]|nr:hypothetical protein [Candidatus Saccharimonadia bacterium]